MIGNHPQRSVGRKQSTWRIEQRIAGRAMLGLLALLTWRGSVAIAAALLLFALVIEGATEADAKQPDQFLAADFLSPPPAVRPWIFWDWLNGFISREQITHDLEEMQKQGIGGVMVFQVMADPVPGGAVVPQGAVFMSDQWRDLFRHAVGEAARLGLEIGLMNSSGWNCGGPWISPAHAGRRLVWSEVKLVGPHEFHEVLPPPTPRVEGGRHVPFQPETVVDIAVLAIPAELADRSIKDWELKAGYREIEQTTPDLLVWPREIGDDPSGIAPEAVRDLTGQFEADGKLLWTVPDGQWIVIRLAHAMGGRERLCAGPGPAGPMLDHLSAEAMDLHFQATAEKLIADAGELAGKTFTFLECDSCDLGTVNWTPRFREEFQRRRGYDMTPYLAALTGRIVGSGSVTERFLYDFRRTIGDCIAENHYGRFRELCRERGLVLMSEAGGPPPVPVDALQCYSRTDVPMGEFWAEDHTMHVRGAASAAHVNGRKLVAAEAFTSWQHWTQGPFELKPFGDRAFCEGMNRCCIHGFSSSPPEAGKPGYVYYAGTHFEPNITWWEQGRAWIEYLTRCQYMLQQGLPVADVCCYYGEGVPNFIPPRRDCWYELCPSLGEDYACDFADVETLLTRVQVRDGALVLPDGMTYRLLVFPEAIAEGFPCHGEFISPELLKKLAELTSAGATIVWPRPRMAPGLRGYPQCDTEIAALAGELWGPEDQPSGERRVGRGRVIWGKTPRQVLQDDGVAPDFEHQPLAKSQQQRLAYIHRRIGEMEVYFIANRDARNWATASCWFRVQGKAPELWHPDTGSCRRQIIYDERDGRTWLPLRLPPAGSVFVVFRPGGETKRIVAVERNGRTLCSPTTTINAENFAGLTVEADDKRLGTAFAAEQGEYVFRLADGTALTRSVDSIPAALRLPGPWTLSFPSGLGAPDQVVLNRLASWTKHDEPGIRFFSGTAVYRTEFSLPADYLANNRQIWLDLGVVKNIAEVYLNGRPLGLLWKPPFHVDATDALQPGNNQLEVRVTNLWPNRLIGDAYLPEDKRFTRTNMAVFDRKSHLLESGLIGPVELHVSERITLE